MLPVTTAAVTVHRLTSYKAAEAVVALEVASAVQTIADYKAARQAAQAAGIFFLDLYGNRGSLIERKTALVRRITDTINL